ncbi:MAG: TetR/AcrR family transcriptional regulator [Spirochaetaceae bacterium]|jgi:AcrR family transcriptional regulator|nr:TetR/AcrR family transcriptional regulator [Spirochaetaceae bacterium]
MARFVEHDERQHEILEKALDVFVEEGFNDTTFQKVADRVDIRRTTLYQYFKDKLELFHFSIKQFLCAIEDDVMQLARQKEIMAPEKITRAMLVVLKRLETNRKLLSVILNFLVNDYSDAKILKYHIRRRTIRFRRIIANLIIDGINAGEIKPVRVREINELIFTFIKAAILELTVLHSDNIDHIISNFEAYVNLLRA